jgi:putative tricarboxylic transport membrane protein
MRQALTISQGDWTVFFTHPIAVTILIISGLVLLLPVMFRLISARRGAGA